ncbi:MAG TPA: Mrp/NBP35 family ATP-binding protein [Gemmataceae bacterium]|nr:Mrp/NBP35 family ATP-binding protein [Gemmataceae bacterium]
MQPQGMGPQKISLPGIRHVVAVSSGKGGVGKSTVATNLAVALRKAGARAGLMDADIYGPSIPIMMGTGTIDPRATPLPVERHGLKMMSMAFVMGPDQAAILRGPMIHKYLTAFLTQIDWGELDYLLIDMPPGTGDATLSLAQAVPVSGVITVVMPQDVSMAVARRGVEAFRQLRVPHLGIVENMSYFVGEDGKRYELFGHGGGEKLAKETGVPFLGQIPVDPRVAECSDAGEPIVAKHPDSPVGKAYQALAARVMLELEKAPAVELPEVRL